MPRDRRSSRPAIAARRASRDADVLRRAKQLGFADRRIADADRRAPRPRSARARLGARHPRHLQDGRHLRGRVRGPHAVPLLDLRGGGRGAADRRARKVVILGCGPNRIGQGIEFDYCCVHAAFALREAGVEAIMVNCNPETVSTDYDTSDRLYFEPLTLEDVLNIVEHEQPLGVIVQFGGQTPLKLAVPLQRAGVPILGHPARRHRPRRGPPALRRAPRRARPRSRRAGGHRALARRGRARSPSAIGYPVLVRPSYVLGGRAMQIVYDEAGPPRTTCGRRCGSRPSTRSSSTSSSRTPSRSTWTRSPTASDVVVGGVMEHIEKAGVHSGDSACALPPYSLGDDQVRAAPGADAGAGRASSAWSGLINIQFAIKQRHDLRAGGQPARLPHGAVRLQGDRRAAGQARHPRHARRDALARARRRRGARAAGTSR